ncbi:oxidoreductase [Arthrobacter alpinus]|uniref:Oxidoreductase n=1 Tax=Arthrobacter alpinus TaxID=656366 RepID=A0A0M3UGX4_9MICC|nr:MULTISPECIES: FAD-dependent oxidoreductase [Arthrobacter]ALE93489.1 oxidoreductase [Arthrobacter alpinus]
MNFDVAVVGAGPAGLAAAVHAADSGLSVVLIDAGTQPGGQFWRHPDEAAAEDPVEGAHHHDWKRFVDLRARLYAHEATGIITYLRNTQVWLIEHGTATTVLRLTPTVAVDGHGPGLATPGMVAARHVILCPGGYDRQLPVPGWDLPGVMAAGGVQALLKGNRSAAGSVAVVGGTGPFLLPVATGLASAGVKVAAICEANSPTGWLKNLRGAVQAPGKVPEGVEYAAVLARHRIPYRVRTAITAIHGTDKVAAVTIAKLAADGSVLPGTGRRVPCDLVALGWGFTAQLELVLAAGAETAVDVDGSLIAVVDERLRSTASGVSVAGEATGVGGAAMAVVEGELAALCVAAEDGLASAGSAAVGARIATLQRKRVRLRAFAVAMHRANPVPARWQEWLTEDTVVCRCEEVTYGALCNAHTELGAQDARSMKSLARPGMGWCQGRVCGYATASIAGHFAGRPTSADDLRSMAKRTLAAPVTLGQLAALTPNILSNPDEGL